MLERLELDGDVEEGTGLVLRATFLVFADAEDDISSGRALRARSPARWELGRVVEAVRPDERVTAAVAGAFDFLGRTSSRILHDCPSRRTSATSRGAARLR